MSNAGAIRTGRAFVELFADKSAFVRTLRSAEKDFKAFGAKVVQIAAVGTAVLADLAPAVAMFSASGDKLDKLSKRTGANVEALSALDYAAQQSGASLEDVEKAMKKTQEHMMKATLLHTLGINLFAGLGREAGFVGLAEYPVPRATQWQRKLVRVDSAWFDRSTRRPVALVEFERYSMETVLEKLTNLYVAAHGCEFTPNLLLLCIWAMDGDPVDAKWFDANRALPVSGGPVVQRPEMSGVMLIQAVIGRQSDSLHFVRFRRLA